MNDTHGKIISIAVNNAIFIGDPQPCCPVCIHLYLYPREFSHTPQTAQPLRLIQIVFCQQTRLVSPIPLRFLSPPHALAASTLTKQWPLLHLFPGVSVNLILGSFTLLLMFLFIQWKLVSACRLSHLHVLISSALLLFKCVYVVQENGQALALHVRQPEQQREGR